MTKLVLNKWAASQWHSYYGSFLSVCFGGLYRLDNSTASVLFYLSSKGGTNGSFDEGP
jgi:hypothetical protein